MNKRSRKMKGFSKRLIALLLCCVCLVAIGPISAIALETDSSAAEDVSTENQTDETTSSSEIEIADATVTPSFYDELMTASSNQGIYELIADDANYDKASTLTTEQVHSIKEYAQTLGDDGYLEILTQTLDQLLQSLGEDVSTEYSTDVSASGGDINPSYYNSGVSVYWDTPSEMSQSGHSTGGANVESVSLNSVAVTWGNSSNNRWNGGTTLASYFPGASANNMKDASMSITAKEGYYVAQILVACAPSGGSGLTPYSCSTWGNDREFNQTYNLTNSSYADGKYTLTFDINSRYFSHDGRTSPNAYFIFVKVAKVPTPLYVEYDYGNVTDFLTVDSNSAFSNPTWTVKNDSNNYGIGSVYTNDTQFAYAYGEDTSVIAQWSHKANTISDAAKAEAAAAGYYFAGWDVTWYNDCSVTASADSHNNNYTMSFSNVYMTGSYNAGDDVQLPTNARLVAKWLPISLKVTKTVEGLSSIYEFAQSTNTFKLTLQNQQNGEFVTLNNTDYTITGDGTLTYTFAASGGDVTQSITPGTYKIVEDGNYDLHGSTSNAYCTTTYPIETVEVTTDGTVKELQVLNSYSETPAAYNLTVKKTISGNMQDPSAKFKFTVAYNGETSEFELGKNESKTISIPVGAKVTVSEDSAGYTYSLTAVTPEGLSYESIDKGISFTMPSSDVSVEVNNSKEITIDTGVLLDKLPYILIIVFVAGGAVLMIRRRKNHRA